MLARYSPGMRDLLRRTKPTRQCESSDGSFIERAGRSLPDGDNAEAELHEVSAAAARIWVEASRAARQTAIHFRNGGGLLIRPAWCSSHRILARSALVWMEGALERRTITAPNRCHCSRLDHRVCDRPARNRVLVRCSPDRSRTVDHHPTITVNPILPISRSPDRIRERVPLYDLDNEARGSFEWARR
jgi:hypothetical protein